MNKTEFINALAERTDVSRAKAAVMVNAIFDPATGIIATELDRGGDVSLMGFGSFKPKARAARQGHNPKTGEGVNVPARTTATFKAGSTLVGLLNR